MELIEKLKIRYSYLDILGKIIVWMVLCFILPYLLNTLLFLFNIKSFSLVEYFHVSADLSELIFKPWSLLTYGFFHAGLWHLAGNMLILYYSGRIVLDLYGENKFLKIFFIGLLFGSLTYLLSYNIFPVFSGIKPPMIGASAGAMAMFIFLTAHNPNLTFRLIFIDVKIIYIAGFLVLSDIIQIPVGNSGGHLAHLGGAFWGYYFNKQLQVGNNPGNWIIKFYDYFNSFFKAKPKVKRVYKNYSVKSNPSKKVDQKKIDEILDKISKSGYDSLSQSEKETLFKAGDN